MKIQHILIALTMIAALTMVSCKNNKKGKLSEEEIEQQKQELADSVLAKLDTFSTEYLLGAANSFLHREFELTEDEKMVKPDYLLDLSYAKKLLTRQQQISGLAIYTIEMGVRKIYDMPLKDAQEVITKLAAEVNYPLDLDAFNNGTSVGDFVRKEYENCREERELTTFWEYQTAVVFELEYLIAQNPDLFFDRITESQWQAHQKRVRATAEVITELAKYDKEMAAMVEAFKPLSSFVEDCAAMQTKCQSKEAARQYYIDNKDTYIINRNELLVIQIKFPF